MQYKAAFRLYWSTIQHMLICNGTVLQAEIDFFKQCFVGNVSRAVNDYAHCTFLIMCANKGNGFCEIGVGQSRHRDEKVSRKIDVFQSSYFIYPIDY